MQIKTITCHDVYNYGASLQAYALQTYLEDKGHHVEIINYKPDYLSHHYDWTYVANPKYRKPILRQIYCLLKFPSYYFSLKRKQKFDHFTKQYLKITTKCYHSNEDLKENPPLADLFIAGSDQIWNTIFPNGKDPAFYLDFVPQEKLRISYAASFATDHIAEGYQDFVKQHLKKLDFISIRERTSLSLLEDLGFHQVSVVNDPVFLLPTSSWKKIASLSRLTLPKQYILVYTCDYTNAINKIAQKIADKLQCKILYIAPTLSFSRLNYFGFTGPIDFLYLIMNAKYVIANSFHAAAFSIIFNKEFCITSRKENINERMVSLLKDYHLEHRMTNSFHPLLLEKINFEEVNHQQRLLKNASEAYLNETLHFQR